MLLGNKLYENNKAVVDREKALAFDMVQTLTDYIGDHINKGLGYPIKFSSSSIDYRIFKQYGEQQFKDWLEKENLYLSDSDYSHPYYRFEIVCRY
jgi:AAA+ superfamily predicted ATPase